jgi:hypothetical protein
MFTINESTGKHVVSAVVLVMGVLIFLCIAFAPQIYAYANPPIRLPVPTLCVQVEGVTQDNGYYNASVTLMTTKATLLQKLRLSPAENSSKGTTVSKETSPDLKVYFNGTAVNPNELCCDLKSGDNLQVNFLIPRANVNYTSGTLMSLAITTQTEHHFTTFSLP